MKLIVGLGNPGEKFEKTRHNLGFSVIDELIKNHNLQPATYSRKFKSLISENILAGQKIILAKPKTFMNNSGQAVKILADYYKIKPENILVVHDDIDLPLGKIRVQKSRGSAGHKGVESIIRALETKNFTRIRIGIKPLTADRLPTTAEKFVLGKFTKLEKKIIQKTTKKSIEAILNG